MITLDYQELRLILQALGPYLSHSRPLSASICNMSVILEQTKEEVDKLKTIIKFLENKIENMEQDR